MNINLEDTRMSRRVCEMNKDESKSLCLKKSQTHQNNYSPSSSVENTWPATNSENSNMKGDIMMNPNCFRGVS